MADDDLLAPDFRTEPWWWTAAPRPNSNPADVPAHADVAIVGSGYTGLSAALTLARAGRSVAIFDTDVAGYGASTRNAGFVGKTLKHSFSSLVEAHGLDTALAYYGEMQEAFDTVADIVRDEQLQCHFNMGGRFMAARTPAQYDAMARELDLKRTHLGDDYEMVPAAKVSDELGSEIFVGGAVVPQLASIHPGLYQLGLLDRVSKAGAKVVDQTPVTAIARAGEGFDVTTTRGTCRAGDVIVATNGYTGKESPWQRRRLISFRGFMIATEELDEDRFKRLMPKDRVIHDFNNNLIFMRRAPDARRILFGGLTGTMTDDLTGMARRLRAKLATVFPDLADVRISRSWSGYCAGTFDLFPHIGTREGVHYALGYCFAGLPMGTYLGRKAAFKVLGDRRADTIFADNEFPARWWYGGGTPWFVPAYMAWLNFLDRR